MSAKNMALVIGNLFQDEDFKKRFLEDPDRVVSEAGLSISPEALKRMFILDEEDVPAWIEPEVHPPTHRGLRKCESGLPMRCELLGKQRPVASKCPGAGT